MATQSGDRVNAKSTPKQREPARRTLNQQIDEFFKKGKEVEKVPGFTHVREK